MAALVSVVQIGELFAAGSERSHRYRFGPAAPGADRLAHLAHLVVEETVFEPMAAAYAALFRQKEGAALRCSTSGCIPRTW